MPRIAPNARAGIFQRFELETGFPESDRRAESKQSLTIGRDEVRHLAPFPDVAAQPQTAIHRVNHPGSAGPKLSILWTCDRLAGRLRTCHFSATAVSIELQLVRHY